MVRAYTLLLISLINLLYILMGKEHHSHVHSTPLTLHM